MRWQKKLTKKEFAHLKEIMGQRPTLTALRGVLAGHEEMRELGGAEPCWECRLIGKKLGINQ